MNDYQWENYNKACQDMRKQNGPPPMENVIRALNRAMQLTPQRTMDKLQKNGRDLWINAASLLWSAVSYMIKIQGGAIVFGAVVGAALIWEAPLFGAGIGARLGAYIASGYLALIGLKTATELVGQVAGSVSAYFEVGYSKAKSGDIEGAAIQFAEGFAQILQMVVALLILYCFVKGGQKLMQRMEKVFTSEPRLISMLKNLPSAVGNIHAYTNSKWGYAFQELQAMKQLSANDCIYVIRACNPARVKVGKGVALEAKGLEIKGKSFQGGVYDGEVGVSLADIKKLQTKYEVTPIELNPNLVNGPKPKNQTPNMKQNAGYRLKLKEGKSGELDGHILEQTIYTAVGDNALKWRLLDKQGRPHIPDMDRLICMEFDVASNKLKELARMMDDPQEIADFNRKFNELVGAKNLVNKSSVKHGYTAASANRKGGLVWHATTDETLLVFVSGKMFEMTWNQLVLFCDANKALNMPTCFKMID